jgi:hypothetical protein
MVDEGEEVSKGLMEGLIDALTDKHAQLDIRLRDLTMRLGGSRMGVEVNGTVTFAVHMRELDEDEKAAHAASTVAALRA